MAIAAHHKPLIAALNRQAQPQVPVWLMRQAGRYLPEYRALREKAGGFLDLVFNPDFATEVTLQPIRRFGMDGAILFSDILVIPHALGQTVSFTAGEGPSLPPLKGASDVARLSMDHFDEIIAPVLQTVRQTRQQLAAEGFEQTALIGFAGAPWTVACYMVEGHGSRDFAAAKSWAQNDPAGFAVLLDCLTQATIRYLRAQIDAGAEAVQIFESWAAVLCTDPAAFHRWIIEPTRAIVAALRESHPGIPVIGFPRGASSLYADYARETSISALGLDQDLPLQQAVLLQQKTPVQGNLDPEILLAGGAALDTAAMRILDALGRGPFIFNLGHGVIKETPTEHVAQLVDTIRLWRRL